MEKEIYNPWLLRKPTETYEYQEIYPSLDISKHIGFDIYKEYSIPGLTLKDSDKYFDNKNKKDFLRGIDDIIQLYPKFNNIIIKSDDRIRLTLYDILRGICSKFCEEDIIFYVNDWLGLQVPTNHVRNMRMVENELKIGFGYIPSPYTL